MCIRKIDDDVRGLARAQVVKHRDAATAARCAFADRFEDADFMHGVVPG